MLADQQGTPDRAKGDRHAGEVIPEETETIQERTGGYGNKGNNQKIRNISQKLKNIMSNFTPGNLPIKLKQ